MAIPIQLKRSTAAGVSPTTLADGEVAINVAASDPKLFYKDSASTIRAFSLASYASASHTHVAADVTDLTTKANVVSVNGITGVVSISHTSVSAAAASHTHDAADVVSGTLDVARIPTIGYTALSGVPATFEPSSHTHVAADVTDFAVEAAKHGPVSSVNSLTGTVTLTSISVSAASAVHSHVVADITDLEYPVASVNAATGSVIINSVSVSAASASHSHIAADITDFATEAAKYGPVASVNSLTGTIVLTSLGVSAASAVHSHVAADISDFTSVANVVSVNAKTGVVSISHTDVTAASASHTHAASDVTSGTFDAARLPLATTGEVGGVIVGTGLGVSSGTVSVTYGTTSGTSCQGNDSRLSDTRTPTDGSVTTAKIEDDAVTYAKIQNVSTTDRLLGRSSAGAGDVEEITCTAFGRSLIDDADAAAARTTLSVQPTASPTFTGTVTVPGLTATAAILADDLSSTNSVVYSFDGDTNTGVGRAGADILTLVTGGSERVRVDASGNVGIGGASGGSVLHVFGTTDAIAAFGGSTNHLRIGFDSTADRALIESADFGTIAKNLVIRGRNIIFENAIFGVAEGMRLTDANELLIGTTTDNGAYKLQVNSQIYATNATIATSDARFKTNVESLTDATAVIEALRPVAFDFIAHEERNFATERQVGLIAQEAQSALAGTDYAESVVAQCGDHLGLAYEKLVPVLIKALQESNARIAALEERINA